MKIFIMNYKLEIIILKGLRLLFYVKNYVVKNYLQNEFYVL